MSDLVDATEIEQIVGARRHPILHQARAVSADRTVYILHSQQCLDSGTDLRQCEYSHALDDGIEMLSWSGVEDRPVRVAIMLDRLVPAGDAPQPTDQAAP